MSDGKKTPPNGDVESAAGSGLAVGSDGNPSAVTTTDPSSPLATPLALKRVAHRTSHDRIYETVLRGGGEPFGKPFDLGLSTLTEKIVQVFNQKGFFAFESLDRPAPQKAAQKRRRNIFTRYAAGRYRGPLKISPDVPPPDQPSTKKK